MKICLKCENLFKMWRFVKNVKFCLKCENLSKMWRHSLLTLSTSTDSLLMPSTNSLLTLYWLSTDSLLTPTDSLLTSTDSLMIIYWLLLNLYWYPLTLYWTASDLLCVWTTKNCWEHSNAICCMDWPGHRPLVQLEHLDLPQFILIYLELPQFTLIYLNIPWFTSIYLNFPWIPQFTLTHHNLS